MFARLNRAMAAKPLTTSLVVTAVKAGAADIMVQTAVEGHGAATVDRQRVALFTAFGFAYQGGFQYWLINHVFERAFPGRGWLPTAQKVLAMNAIGDPVFFFPVFYSMKEAFATRRFEPATVSAALRKYRANIFEDWRNTWSIWIPGHVVTYGLCPLHLRMPWVAALSFAYLSILSATRGQLDTATGTRAEHAMRRVNSGGALVKETQRTTSL